MTTITTYRIEGESPEALWTTLRAASNGETQPYAFSGEADVRAFDEARVRLPWLDDSTGRWTSEVALVDGEDASLAALATIVMSDDGQAARG